MTKQCWLWGCDIRRLNGNGLLDYGFTRIRPPEGRTGSSSYCYTLSPETSIYLWGFGMAVIYGDDTGVFIRRHSFFPYSFSFKESGMFWHPSEMPPIHTAVTESKTALMWSSLYLIAKWVSHYERRNQEIFGSAHRLQCVDPTSDTASVCNLSSQWKQLAANIHSHCPNDDWITDTGLSLQRIHQQSSSF